MTIMQALVARGVSLYTCRGVARILERGGGKNNQNNEPEVARTN